MAADFISNTGENYKLDHADLLELQETTRSISVIIEMDVQYSKEDALLIYNQLSHHKGNVLLKRFLNFIKKSGGFIIY